MMSIDAFSQFADGPSDPASRCFPIIPHASNDLPMATKALYVGTGGHVMLRPIGSEADVLFRNISSGSTIDVRVRAVRAAGTTASDIVGLA
jgi:hypothetical protein